MTANIGTNITKAFDRTDARLFELLRIWSDLAAAAREAPRTRQRPAAVVDLATWRTKSAEQAPIPPPLYRKIAEGRVPPDELVEPSASRDLKAALIRAVDELPPSERTLISLYYFEGLPLKEIRSALNVSESQVSQLHARAVIHLRAQLSNVLSRRSQSDRAAHAKTLPKEDVRPQDTPLQEVLDRFHAISPGTESIAIRNGLSANTWKALQLFGFERREIASVIGTSEKTLHRKIAMAENLSVAEGDRTMRLTRVVLHAFEAFADLDKGMTWLRRPNRALIGQTPLEMMVTEAGAALVRRALGVIAYGGVA